MTKAFVTTKYFLFSVLLAGVILSLTAFSLVRNWENKAVRIEFEIYANERTRIIQNAIDDNIAVLQTIGAFYGAGRDVGREEFRSFTEGLFSLHPDIYEFRWLKRVKDTERADYEEAMQKDGFPGLVIREFDSAPNLKRAQGRAEYFPVTYIEPAPKDRGIFGIDAASAPERWEAMQRARDEGAVAAAANIRSPAEEHLDYICRIFLPIYRNELPHDTLNERRANLRGFVAMILAVDKMINASLEKTIPIGLDTYIFDAQAKAGEKVLYFRQSRKAKVRRELDEKALLAQKGLFYATSFPVAGSIWSVICVPTPEFMAEHSRSGAWIVLGISLLVTVILVFYLNNIFNRTIQIEALVVKRTQELTRANAMNEALLKTIPFPMDIVDAEGNILYLNANMQEVAGSDAMGKKCWSLYRDDKQQCSDCPLIKGITVGEIASIEAGGVFGGKTFQISHTGMIFQGKKAVMEIFQDITERKRSEELIKARNLELENTKEGIRKAYQTTRNVIDNAPFGIYIVNESGEIEYVNQAMLKISGTSREEFMAINVFEFSAYKEIGLSENIRACLAGKQFKMDEVEYTSHLGKKTTFRNFSGICVTEESDKKAIVIVEDITERKHLERLKDEFVSTVSHELRTPLSIIKEGISLVLDKVPGEINNKQGKILGTANENIDRLTRIINDLLDISRIESGRMELRKQLFDLAALIRQAVDLFGAKIREKGLELKLNLSEEKVEIFADPDRISEVLTNLLGNALKFTEKGYIEVALRDGRDAVECFVLDTGIGIAESDLPKVFDKFEQFHRFAGAGPKGTGLGLSITKGIIEMHHGKIWVESKLGEGTKFVFNLPRKAAGQSAGRRGEPLGRIR